MGAEDKETVDGFVQQEGWRKEKKISIVEGGAERFDSVAAALHFIEEKGNPENYVFIHDAARPFFTEDLLERLYKELQYSKAVIPGIPVKDTIKVERDGIVEKSLDRKTLYAVQTPQVFDFQVLSRAFKSFLPRREEWKDKITDDAMIVEEFSKERIRLIAGEEENIKIDFPKFCNGFMTMTKDGEKPISMKLPSIEEKTKAQKLGDDGVIFRTKEVDISERVVEENSKEGKVVALESQVKIKNANANKGYRFSFFLPKGFKLVDSRTYEGMKGEKNFQGAYVVNDKGANQKSS